MVQELTKDICVQKYEQCKLTKNGAIPEYREFLKYASIPKRQLDRLFGASAYSKLQIAAGDKPNKLELQRASLETIMRQYGKLVTEFAAIPPSAEWEHRGLRPTQDGLRRVHGIKWSEFPDRFLDWVNANNIIGFEKAIEIIAESVKSEPQKTRNDDLAFQRLIRDVAAWTPARRRNSEGEYKIELRKHLETLRYKLNEEFGESNYDLLVCGEYAIEIKKDPNLSEYDRLFGQVARHLQHQCKVIVLTLQATRGDTFDNFTALIDKYLNVDESSVEVIKK